MMSDHSPKDVFLIVSDHIKQKKKSLRQVKSYKNAGIEGWFKVETIAALQDYVKEVRNKSPDLVVEVHENRMEIALIATTDFNPFNIKLRALQHKTLCLFLGDGSDKEKIEELLSDTDIDFVNRETFRDNGNKWIIGLIKPSEEYLFHHQE
jgi:hypothetical protein